MQYLTFLVTVQITHKSFMLNAKTAKIQHSNFALSVFKRKLAQVNWWHLIQIGSFACLTKKNKKKQIAVFREPFAFVHKFKGTFFHFFDHFVWCHRRFYGQQKKKKNIRVIAKQRATPYQNRIWLFKRHEFAHQNTSVISIFEWSAHRK